MTEFEDFGTDENWEEFATDREKTQYNERYHKAVAAQLEQIKDDVERENTFDTLMNDVQYQPSGNAKNDAELVLTKARNIMNSKEKNIDPAVDSYVQYIANQDGTTKKAVLKKYRSAMVDKDNARLNKPGFF